VPLRVLVVEEEELGHHRVGYLVVNGSADEDDAVPQQARVDVVYPLAPVAALHDVRDNRLRLGGPEFRIQVHSLVSCEPYYTRCLFAAQLLFPRILGYFWAIVRGEAGDLPSLYCKSIIPLRLSPLCRGLFY